MASRSYKWDYKFALAILTLLAFATRFYRINHPDSVVFDEVHFGKVCQKTRRITETSFSIQ